MRVIRDSGQLLRHDRRPRLQLCKAAHRSAAEQPGERPRPNAGIAVSVARLPRSAVLDDRRYGRWRRDILNWRVATGRAHQTQKTQVPTELIERRARTRLSLSICRAPI